MKGLFQHARLRFGGLKRMGKFHWEGWPLPFSDHHMVRKRTSGNGLSARLAWAGEVARQIFQEQRLSVGKGIL